MKNSVRKIAQIVSVIAALAIIGSVAFAYTNPTGPAPTGNVPAPVNTGTFMQTKLEISVLQEQEQETCLQH